MKISSLLHRIKSDFFVCNRIKEFEAIIQKGIENNYVFLSHSEYFELVKNQEIEGKKIFIVRQDIDSDPKYIYHWLKIQKKYNFHSSMYFRLCTFDKKAMQAVKESGSDCGYHYEEIADFAKKHKLLKKEAVEARFSEIRQIFKSNLREMEEELGFKIKYIASHGDFANRKLNLANHVFVNQQLLNECKLLFEAYQPEFTQTYSINISDCGAPNWYKGNLTPMQAIEQEVPIIHFLMHPKHWRSSWYWNIYENFKRVKEGLFYR